VVGDPRVPVEGGGYFDTSTLIGRHRATISVTAVDDDDSIAAVISSGYSEVLAGLKARLETSSSPSDHVTTRRVEPGTYRAETTVQRSADDVWTVVRDFGELSWYPGVERCVLDGNDRTTWKHGSALASIERILVDDDMAARISHGYGAALANLKAQLEAVGRRYGGDFTPHDRPVRRIRLALAAAVVTVRSCRRSAKTVKPSATCSPATLYVDSGGATSSPGCSPRHGSTPGR
jgi:hypothetical protein